MNRKGTGDSVRYLGQGRRVHARRRPAGDVLSKARVEVNETNHGAAGGVQRAVLERCERGEALFYPGNAGAVGVVLQEKLNRRRAFERAEHAFEQRTRRVLLREPVSVVSKESQAGVSGVFGPANRLAVSIRRTGSQSTPNTA
jgi:hypothetical protein